MAQSLPATISPDSPTKTARIKDKIAAALDHLLEYSVDFGVQIAFRLVQLLFPHVRSRTGFENPRVRHITGWTYMYYLQTVVSPNIEKWMAQRGPLFPHVIQVQTINRCNAACQMCPYPYTVHLQPKQIMEDAIFSKIVAECAGHPDLREFVPMSKNEPLLDPKLEERIAEFKAVAAPHQLVEVVTNASALTPRRYEKLMQSGLDLLTISLSAHTEATFNKVMRGLSWTQVRKNLEALSKASTSKVNVVLRFVRQRDNDSEFTAFRRYWLAKGFNVMPFSLNNRAGVVKNYSDILPIARHRIEERSRHAMGRRYLKVCPHAFSLMHVLENGDVPLCANDWENREILGNVQNNTLAEIYNGARFQEIRELMVQGRYEEIPACKDCSFWKDWL
jgi:radical SAM protein with 4Fe4S-binding SPASM domain